MIPLRQHIRGHLYAYPGSLGDSSSSSHVVQRIVERSNVLRWVSNHRRDLGRALFRVRMNGTAGSLGSTKREVAVAVAW
jgi:hypothetical protein